MAKSVRGLLAATLLLAAADARAAAELTYHWVFDATWSAQTHPVEFPSNAHFSPPIGALHNDQVVFWRIGALASDGIERMAEVGATSTFAGEIAAAAQAGNAAAAPTLGPVLDSPGESDSSFVTTEMFDRLTWVSMLAPSPDWFVGVDSLSLRPRGEWIEEIVVPLLTYDAGTDNGVTFGSSNSNTNPAQPIQLITTSPLAPDGNPTPVGTLTIRLIAVDNMPPHEDPDEDGLTNVEEASAGTEPLEPDTDGDSLLDGADNCPTMANVDQADGDRDHAGDVCDVCPTTSDGGQGDIDSDGEGDACDVDDGLLRLARVERDVVAWQDEPVFDRFNLYRGDLATLRSTGAAAITQPPGGLADRFCDLTEPSLIDDFAVPPGDAVYYLVTGVVGLVESPPGYDGAGNPRGNPATCLE